MLRTPALFLVLLSAAASSAPGEVVARQGAPAQDQRFASPMILEIPLPNVTTLGDWSSVPLPDVHHYICDNNVSLVGLSISKNHHGFGKRRALDLVIAGKVNVTDSYDRRVDIALSVRTGDQVIGSQTLHDESTEEEEMTAFRIVVPVDESRLKAAYSAAEGPTLAITLTVHDDS